MTINTSTIVYAYADQFVEARSRGGVDLPCRDVRVKKQDLAATAMTTAFVGLAEAAYVRLYVGTRRALLGLRKRSAVFVEPLRGAASIGGLEGSLLASLSDSQDANAVRTIVERLLPISGDPWGDVIAHIEEGMLDEGYFLEGERKKVAKFFLGKKLEPDCQRIGALQEQLPSVRDMVDGFRQANGALYEQLIKDVRQGIRARLEVDVDID
jgi:hypothetical protein